MFSFIRNKAQDHNPKQKLLIRFNDGSAVRIDGYSFSIVQNEDTLVTWANEPDAPNTYIDRWATDQINTIDVLDVL